MPQAEKPNFENLSETELKSAKKVNEKLKELQLNEYPEDFLNDLKEQDPKAFQEFRDIEYKNEAPKETIRTLDSALSEWEYQENYNKNAYYDEGKSLAPETPEERMGKLREEKEKPMTEAMKKHLEEKIRNGEIPTPEPETPPTPEKPIKK